MKRTLSALVAIAAMATSFGAHAVLAGQTTTDTTAPTTTPAPSAQDRAQARLERQQARAERHAAREAARQERQDMQTIRQNGGGRR